MLSYPEKERDAGRAILRRLFGAFGIVLATLAISCAAPEQTRNEVYASERSDASASPASFRARAHAVSQDVPILDTGHIYLIGEDIPLALETDAATVNYQLEWIAYDRDEIIAGTYTGTGVVEAIYGIGSVAWLPTSMLTRKGVYILSGEGVDPRRVLLVDPMPEIEDATTWPFGLILSVDKIDRGAAMAEELHRAGIRWFHFDYPISDEFYFDWPYSINAVGASSDPNAGQVTPGFDAFITRSDELGIIPIFKMMAHYRQIEEPQNLNGPFYEGLRRIQTYYQGKLKYWTIGNEVEGGGYSQFTPDEYAEVISNMSQVLKAADPNVQIIAGEFYDAYNQHLDRLILPQYRDTWDVLSVHNTVSVNSRPSEYQAHLEGVVKPIWDTEANGTMFGGPSEWSNYMHSTFPVYEDADLHSGVNKHLIRAFCLEGRSGDTWATGYYNPETACLGVDLFIAMHYDANWEEHWALRRHWISDFDAPSEQNHKVANWRAVTDLMYGATGLTRIPDMEKTNPYDSSPTDSYDRADGYILRYGGEYVLALWQNAANSRQDRELILTTNPSDSVVLFDSFGNRYPLVNDAGNVKVWVRPEVVYVRGFTQLPLFGLDETDSDAPYFVTEPLTRAVAGEPYVYTAWAYDSDTPQAGMGDDSMPRINYELVDGPEGMTLDGGVLSWTPASAGSADVRLRAASMHGSTQNVEQAFTIQVELAGDDIAPDILTYPATLFAREGYLWWYNVNAHDLNGDAIQYTLGDSPSGMTIDAASGLIEWMPTEAGVSRVEVFANGGQRETSQSFFVRVGQGSTLPNAATMDLMATPVEVQSGEYVTITAEVLGNGEPLLLSTSLPAELLYLVGDTTCPGAVSYDSDLGQITYAGTVELQAACAVSIVVRAESSAETQVTVEAVLDDGILTPPMVDRTTITILSENASDISVEKRAIPDRASAGEQVLFVIQLGGAGSQITVTDGLPDTFDLLATETTCSGELSFDHLARSVSFIGDLDSSQPCTISIRTEVNTNEGRVSVNRVQVDSEEGSQLLTSEVEVSLNPPMIYVPFIVIPGS